MATEIENHSFNVYSKITDEERIKWYLYIDAVYKSNPEVKNSGGDVISKLLPVGNMGGFRIKGSRETPELVVLFTSGEDIYWKDELDTATGLLLYYGDNKKPGNDLHKTKVGGNLVLKYIFDYACSDDMKERKKIPPIFVFRKNNSIYDQTSSGRDMKFLGLAVPGIIGKPNSDWLTAVWGCNRDGDRFQNYKAYFTILDTSSGCEFEKNSGINLAWINDIQDGKTYESKFAPKAWKKYIAGSKILPLSSRCAKFVKTKEEQLPPINSVQFEMLKHLQKYFVTLDGGYSFESFACDMAKYLDSSVIDINTTNPYKDGGFDGIGKYRIFNKVENEVYVDFYLQAKCYNPESNPVVVKDTARLISRIKDRQFGIMITTSYVAQQAYEEIVEDGHPIVIITGKNIIDYIFDKLQKRSVEELDKWLKQNYVAVAKEKDNDSEQVIYPFNDLSLAVAEKTTL